MAKESIPIGRTLIYSISKKDSTNVLIDLSNYYNIICHVKIGKINYKYSKLPKVDYLPFYNSTTNYEYIKISSNITKLAKSGDELTLTWFAQEEDVIKTGEYINTPLTELFVGSFVENTTKIEVL